MRLVNAKPGKKSYKCPVQGCHERFSLTSNERQLKLQKKIKDFVQQRWGEDDLYELQQTKEDRAKVQNFWNWKSHDQSVEDQEGPDYAGRQEEEKKAAAAADSSFHHYYFEGGGPDDDYGLNPGDLNIIDGYYGKGSD